MIITNSGPIISFARADYLYLLKETVKELIIPNAVFEDIVVKGRGKPGAEEVKEAERCGLECIGSLRILKEAKETDLIERVKPILDRLRDSGLRIKNDLYFLFLESVEE